MDAASARPSWGLRVYRIVMACLFALGLLGVLSANTEMGIAVVAFPIAISMAAGLLAWNRPWVVATLVGAVAAFSIVYAGTAPRTCLQIVEQGDASFDARENEYCDRERLFLPDLRRTPIPEDRGLALALAATAGGLTAGAAGLSAYAISRWRNARAQPA